MTNIVVETAPTETKMLLRPEKIEIETRRIVYKSKKDCSKNTVFSTF